MSVTKLVAGLAVGYVLGARAGREKYEQIVAVAQQARGGSGPARTGPRASDAASDASDAASGAAGAAVTPTVEPSAGQPRPPRKRRPKPAVTTATPDTGASGITSSLGAEADVVEQKTLVVDTRDEPARSSSAVGSDSADVLEQRRSL